MPNRISELPPLPAVDCFVTHSKYEGVLGRVIDHESSDGLTLVGVAWGADQEIDRHPVDELRNGFRPGHVVQDRPRSNTRRPLGTGTVLACRRIADRDMVLVQLHRTGESRWLPYEKLIRIRDAGIRYVRAETSQSEAGERFRLKALAHALDSWNQVTGALDRLDVDPLPHQIDLVHRIMTSDQQNWLIADDVGLGKTIEVGLLLAAMKRRREARRVLVVCPAGMVRQWQDEMKFKFNQDFRIYGLDFHINQPSHWTTYDKVIVSIDTAKSDTHGPIFNETGDWDVIVFDEAHHLSKIPGQSTTQRYALAERLKSMTDRLMFLTGTPHQGKTSQFVNLLLLLRPDLSHRFATMFTDPSVVAEVVLRNRKSLATDANGAFLFRGQETHLIRVPLSDAASQFSDRLRSYLRHGYAASETGGSRGRAIGFVMTTYRKLASSSIAAIERALQRRLWRLQTGAVEPNGVQGVLSLEDLLEAIGEGSDVQEDLDSIADQIATENAGVSPFFDQEQVEIAALLEAARSVARSDSKLQQFLSEIVDPLHRRGEQLLIFTEYRATQEYLVDALKGKYPESGVCQLNGSMSLNEKRANIETFNREAQFMISTEAGGEGINLHERCHILVNYDLPWNPSRLVQRSGRLYRYGQDKRVIAFNLTSNDGFDNLALGMMLERVLSIAQDMSEVSSEFSEGLQAEIIGELLERLDVASILSNNRHMDIDRSDAEIDEAISRAREAKSQQERLFAHIEGYDPRAAAISYSFGSDAVLSFLEGILRFKGIDIRARVHDGLTLEIGLPEGMRGRYAEFPERATFVRVTVDRRIAQRDSRVVAMDFASSFFNDLVEFAKSPAFNGQYAKLKGAESGTLALYKMRWQSDQGIPRWEAVIPIFLNSGKEDAVVEPSMFEQMVVRRSVECSECDLDDTETRKQRLSVIKEAADNELARRCTELRHPNDVILLAAADICTDS